VEDGGQGFRNVPSFIVRDRGICGEK
jgi:hypothetical protein